MNNDGAKDFITISVNQDKGLVFSVDDIKKLRERYKVLGILSGTLAVAPQQSNFLSVPLQLSLEEVIYLVLFHGSASYKSSSNNKNEGGYAVRLSDDSFILDQLADGFFNTEEKEKYLNSLCEDFRKQIQLKKQEIVETRKKYESKMKNKNRNNNEKTVEKLDVVKYGINDKDLNLIFHEIPNTSHLLPNYKLAAEYVSKNEKMTQKELLIKLIVANLNEKHIDNDLMLCHYLQKLELYIRFYRFALGTRMDYYISPGMKFGGKYIMYPGDPLRYHSHYIINFYSYQEDPVNLLRLVGGGRLAVGVKKVWVLSCSKSIINTTLHEEKKVISPGKLIGSYDLLPQRTHDQIESFLDQLCEDENDQVVNFSVEWAGFG